MTKEKLHEKFKLEDFFYCHMKDDYKHENFIFKQGEFYSIDEDEGGRYIVDDNGRYHDVYDMDYNMLSMS